MWAGAILIVCVFADDVTQKMTERVSEEAEAFLKIASQVLGTEKLHQRAQKPPPRFHPRVGAAAMNAPAVPQWKEHDLISEYGFAPFTGEAGAIHELREVISVDGKKVADSKKAQAALAKAIAASGDEQKRAVLKQFEKYGLTGAVTDFGQLLLLFTRREIERYEFAQQASKMIGYDRALVFSYKQIDGPEALTLFDAKDKVHRLKVEGEIRVRATDFVPLQITIAAHEGDAPNSVREEAAVSYAMSAYGTLLPTSTEHRELRAGKVVAENQFLYTDFHKFGASSGITFEVK